MLGDKIKATIEGEEILVKNKTAEQIKNCYMQVMNIYYCCVLANEFSIGPNETLRFNINSYSFKDSWFDKNLYIKIYSGHKLILEKTINDKTKCFVLISNKNYEKITEQLIVGLRRYSNVDILHYTIDYKTDLDYDYLRNIEFTVGRDAEDHQYMQFSKPCVFLDVIEKGYKNAVFIDSDVQVRSNINKIFSYINEIEDGPVMHKSAWDFVLINGRYVPGPLLQNVMNLPNQNTPHGVTNMVVFSNKHYDLFKEWKKTCFSKEIEEIRKSEFIHDELILNCLFWKLSIKPKLFFLCLNVVNENDVNFFYNHKSVKYNNEINMNDFGLGYASQSLIPYDRSEVLGFHCVKDVEIAKNINDLIFKKEVINKESTKKMISIYNDLIKQKKIKQNIDPTFIVNYLNGACLQIFNSVYKSHEFKFINKKTNEIEFAGSIKNNHWAKLNKQYFTDLKIEVSYGDNKVYEDSLSLSGQKVYIAIESSSLGDNLAWIPYVEEFRKRHNCQMLCSTFFNNLFNKAYPEIQFVNPDYEAKDLKACFRLGWFFNEKNEVDYNRNPSDFRESHLQKTASDILGLEFEELRPKINTNAGPQQITKKYVCIATQSTSQCKYWNNPLGWQKIVDYLKFLNYEVVCIDQHEVFGTESCMNKIPNGCANKTGNRPLEERINDLIHCEFFIGLGSGLSWLAWACDKPVIMISGFSDPKSEFYTPYRVHNKNVCNSCWNSPDYRFDPSNWLWCPRNKNFECSREITFEMVKEKIDQCIKDSNILA